MALLGSTEVDGGLLDVNLRGETSYPVAAALLDRGVPFAFLSGYAPNQLHADYSEHPLLSKPIDPFALRSLLNTMLDQA